MAVALRVGGGGGGAAATAAAAAVAGRRQLLRRRESMRVIALAALRVGLRDRRRCRRRHLLPTTNTRRLEALLDLLRVPCARGGKEARAARGGRGGVGELGGAASTMLTGRRARRSDARTLVLRCDTTRC